MPDKYLFTTSNYNTDEESRHKPISKLDIKYTVQLFNDFRIKYNKKELLQKLQQFNTYSDMERWRTDYIKKHS